MDVEYVWIVNQFDFDEEPYEEFWLELHKIFASREAAVKYIEDFEYREDSVDLPYLLSPNIEKMKVCR
jgi:hypothetical protein